MNHQTIRAWPSTSPGWKSSMGTSDADLAWGTWRGSIGRVPPRDVDLPRACDRASARWPLISAILGYSRAYPELLVQLQRDGCLSFAYVARKSSETDSTALGAVGIASAAIARRRP